MIDLIVCEFDHLWSAPQIGSAMWKFGLSCGTPACLPACLRPAKDRHRLPRPVPLRRAVVMHLTKVAASKATEKM